MKRVYPARSCLTRVALCRQVWRVTTALIATGTVISLPPRPVTLSSTASPPAASLQGESRQVSSTLIPQPTSPLSAITPPPKTESSIAPLVARAATQPKIGSPVMKFCHPLGGLGHISQGNGGATHQGRMYYAYDLASPIGTPVYAMRSGQVISLYDRFPDTGGGREKINEFNYVYLEHAGGYRSIYVHLQQNFRKAINLKPGDWVKVGDLIGYSGNSGWSGAPHLHIEVQSPGQSLRKFTPTVPFALASQCDSVIQVAQTNLSDMSSQN